MDDRGSNIDIVFRNGLKDFEVLPPTEIWHNIYPAIRRRQRPFILMRAAALIAAVLTMSFLAYRWSLEISAGIDNSTLAVNEESSLPEMSSRALARPVALNQDKPVLLQNDQSISMILDDQLSTAVNENISAPQLAVLPEANSMSVKDNSTLKRAGHIIDKSLDGKKFLPLEPEIKYITVDEIVKTTNRWSIAALASPTYYSRFNSGTDELSRQLASSEQPLVSYSGGIAFSYKINKRFSVQSGLFYSAIGQEVNGINSFSGFRPYDNTKSDHNFEVQTTNGTVFTSNRDLFLIADGSVDRIATSFTKDVFDPDKANLQYINDNLLQNFSYLELPVILRYKFIDKTIDFNLIGGLSYNMLVGNSVFTTGDGGKYFVGETAGLNLITFSSSLGMGVEYSVSEKLSLNLEPTFRYYINPFNQMTISGVHPYSFGIFSGISYKF